MPYIPNKEKGNVSSCFDRSLCFFKDIIVKFSGFDMVCSKFKVSILYRVYGIFLYIGSRMDGRMDGLLVDCLTKLDAPVAFLLHVLGNGVYDVVLKSPEKEV